MALITNLHWTLTFGEAYWQWDAVPGAHHYVIFRDGTPVDAADSTNYLATQQQGDPFYSGNYTFGVGAVDAGGAQLAYADQHYWDGVQKVFGQTDALALAIVDWLTANSGTFVLPVAAERRFALIDDLPSIPVYNAPASVDVFPDIEVSQRQGISTAFSSEYAVHIYIQQQVGGAADEEAQCALLAQLRSQIVESLKLRAFQLTNAVHPVPNVFLAHVKSADKAGLYNLARLLELHVFESDTILIFKAAV